MTGRCRHTTEKPGIDEKTRAKIISLFRDHDVTRTALVERFGCSLTIINDVLRQGGVVVVKSDGSALDRCFAAIQDAAIAGKRCPMNSDLPGGGPAVSRLARAGRLFVEVFVHNFRRVTILEGEHRGKTTANPPLHGGRSPKPWLTVGRHKRRNGAVISTALDARST